MVERWHAIDDSNDAPKPTIWLTHFDKWITIYSLNIWMNDSNALDGTQFSLSLSIASHSRVARLQKPGHNQWHGGWVGNHIGDRWRCKQISFKSNRFSSGSEQSWATDTKRRAYNFWQICFDRVRTMSRWFGNNPFFGFCSRWGTWNPGNGIVNGVIHGRNSAKHLGRVSLL